ncbi:MAG: hypothetical protein V4505_19460 [Pseudomonadota bacterium]
MNHTTLLAKTDAGLRVLKDRSVPLAPRQRSAFIMFDGKHTLGEVLQALAGMGVVAGDVETLVEAGLLAPSGEAPAATAEPAVAQAAAVPPPASAPAPAPASGHSSQDRYREASAIATELTAGLGLRGFRLNLAVEAAMGLDDLRALVPKIRAAVGPEKCTRLEQALNG